MLLLLVGKGFPICVVFENKTRSFGFFLLKSLVSNMGKNEIGSDRIKQSIFFVSLKIFLASFRERRDPLFAYF